MQDYTVKKNERHATSTKTYTYRPNLSNKKKKREGKRVILHRLENKSDDTHETTESSHDGSVGSHLSTSASE